MQHQTRVFLAELSKFGLIGLINTGLDFAILNVLHFALGVGPLTSKCVSTVIAATTSYLMNRHWTFKSRARSGMRREYTLFFLLNLVGLVIGLVCIGVARYGFNNDSAAAINFANLVGLVIGTAFRFWSYRRWVFLADGHLAVEEVAVVGEVAVAEVAVEEVAVEEPASEDPAAASLPGARRPG